jgi:ABC-type phosphate transport system substrate-binding protein
MKPRTFVIATALLGAALAWSQDTGFKLIVNPTNTTASITRDEVSRIFLKKGAWSNGTPAQPVELPESSPVRKRFSQEVHGKTAAAIVAYWQQQIFSGRSVPPPTKGTDSEVVAFVKSNAGAVGYVSAGAATDGVSTLKVEP